MFQQWVLFSNVVFMPKWGQFLRMLYVFLYQEPLFIKTQNEVNKDLRLSKALCMKCVFSSKRVFVPKWGTIFNTSYQLLRIFLNTKKISLEELFKPNEVDPSDAISPCPEKVQHMQIKYE